MNDRFYRHLVRQSADGGSFTTHQAAFQRHKFSYSTCRWYHFGARIVRQFFKFQQRRINKMSMKEQSKSAVFFHFKVTSTCIFHLVPEHPRALCSVCRHVLVRKVRTLESNSGEFAALSSQKLPNKCIKHLESYRSVQVSTAARNVIYFSAVSDNLAGIAQPPPKKLLPMKLHFSSAQLLETTRFSWSTVSGSAERFPSATGATREKHSIRPDRDGRRMI